MRVMVLRPGPRYSVQDVSAGLVKGLTQNGCTVYDFRLDDLIEFYSAIRLKRGRKWQPVFDEREALHVVAEHILSATYKFWPDVVIVVSAFWVPPEVWESWAMRPPHVVGWLTECPYEDDVGIRIAERADTVIVNDPVSIPQFRKVNERTWYLPHSYDPDVHCPGDVLPELACDVAFAGTGFDSRQRFMSAVDWSGLDVKLAGMWIPARGTWFEERLVHPIDECLDNADTVCLYNSCKASFNLYRKETTPGGAADGEAMGPREVELAASGTFFLRDPRPEGDERLPMLPTFTSPEEFGDKLRWWLAHGSQRMTAARQARQAVQGQTFQATAAQLLRLVDGYEKTIAA